MLDVQRGLSLYFHRLATKDRRDTTAGRVFDWLPVIGQTYTRLDGARVLSVNDQLAMAKVGWPDGETDEFTYEFLESWK